MTTHSSDYKLDRWWEIQTKVDTRIAGVFEGGGAKGIAFVGALEAVLEKRCWFRAVAGASAGAITAALVAAGLRPIEIEAQVQSGLAKIRTSTFSGLLRLRSDGGYYAKDRLLEWLDEIICKQVRGGWRDREEPPITFDELYAATGIELNVVAANISDRQQIVFNHMATPNCQVSDAVIASSSIPFAFADSLISLASEDEEIYSCKTIVDGGVWANFPMFIFDDPVYRRFAGRSVYSETTPVVGFLLSQESERNSHSLRDARFVRHMSYLSGPRFEASEWKTSALASMYDSPLRPRQWLAVFVFAPLAFLGRLAGQPGVPEQLGRWPKPKQRVANYLVDIIDGTLNLMRGPISGIFILLFVIVSTFRFIPTITPDLGQSQSPFTVQGYGLMILLLPVVLFGLCAIFFLNFFLYRACRKVLYSLARTLVTASGAPPWTSMKKNVIVLPIPRGITTLNFNLPNQGIKDLIERAKQHTGRRLSEILDNGD